jgi:hypothetical protein
VSGSPKNHSSKLGIRWHDDHLFLPDDLRRRGGSKLILAPDGGDDWAPSRPDPLFRALVGAHRWKGMLEETAYRSAAEIAEAEKVTRSFVNRLLRLTLLAPDIQEAILDGRQPKWMQIEDLTRVMPSTWADQRESIAIARPE